MRGTLLLVRIGDHPRVSALEHEGHERLDVPDRVEPVLEQRIGHLRKRHLQESARGRIDAVALQPFRMWT